MKIKLVFFLLAFLLFNVSCKNTDIVAEEITYVNLDVANKVESIIGYISDIQIVRFKMDSTMYVQPKKILLSDNYMFLLSGGQVLQFDKSGNFGQLIGRIGRGPGEYSYAMDACLNYSEQELLCLTNKNEVLKYDATSGSFLRKITVDCPGETANAIVPLKDDGFALMFNNPADVFDFDSIFYNFKCFNKNGRFETGMVERTDYCLPLNMFSPSIQCAGNSYVLSFLPSSGVFYCASNGGINKYMDLDLGRKELPYRFMVDGRNSIEKINEALTSEYLKFPSSLSNTSDLYYCSVFGDHSLRHNYMMSFDGEHGITWTSSRFVMPSVLAAADSESFYFIISPDVLPVRDEFLDNATSDPLQEAIETISGISIYDENMPFIAKIKFKLK